MRWARWERPTGCTEGPKSGAVELRDWFSEVLPEGRDGGIFNCRKVRGSDAPSVHGEGRAVDWMLPVVDGRGSPTGRIVIEALGRVGDRLGVQCVIFDRTIWSGRSPNGRRYDGVHPHYDHIHAELTRDAASRLTVSSIRSAVGDVDMPDVVVQTPTLRRGSRGPSVATVQRALGVTADGIFGPKTEQAVRRFQRKAHLKQDGIVGPATWGRLAPTRQIAAGFKHLM